jgi:hypothetical protein
VGEKKTPWPQLPHGHDELKIEARHAAIETLTGIDLTVDGIGPVIA